MSTAVVIADLTAEQFHDLCMHDVFGKTPPDLAALLRSDEHLERFYTTLQVQAADITGQITEKRAGERGGEPFDPDWNRRVAHVRRKVDGRLIELRPLVKELNRRQADRRRDGWRTLLDAIATHRDATLGEDYDPTAADRTLWQTIEGLE